MKLRRGRSSQIETLGNSSLFHCTLQGTSQTILLWVGPLSHRISHEKKKERETPITLCGCAISPNSHTVLWNTKLAPDLFWNKLEERLRCFFTDVTRLCEDETGSQMSTSFPLENWEELWIDTSVKKHQKQSTVFTTCDFDF